MDITLLYSQDGRLATGGSNGQIKLWDWLRRDGVASRLAGHAAPGERNIIMALCVLPDSGRLASGCTNGTIRVWNATTGVLVAELSGHESSAQCLAALPERDGRCLLASGSQDATVRLWDPVTATQLAVLRGHTGTVQAVALLTIAGALKLASASLDKSLRIWNLTSYECEQTIETGADIYSLVALPDGRIASGHEDSIVYVWDFNHTDGRSDVPSKSQVSRDGWAPNRVYSLAVLPDGRLAMGSGDYRGTIRITAVPAPSG
jgi:WD40 repeat protein